MRKIQALLLVIIGLICWLIADVGSFTAHADDPSFHFGFTAIGTFAIFCAFVKWMAGRHES